MTDRNDVERIDLRNHEKPTADQIATWAGMKQARAAHRRVEATAQDFATRLLDDVPPEIVAAALRAIADEIVADDIRARADEEAQGAGRGY